jgi:Chaperone of endosialidase
MPLNNSGNASITGSLTIGASTSATQLNIFTSSVSTQNVMTEFYNSDYTTNTRNFIRVRNQINVGSTMSSYFGQGQDGKTYIVSNDFTKNHIVIDGNSTYVGINKNTPNAQLDVNGSAILSGSINVTGNITGSGYLALNNGGYGWIYANDVNHSIIMRGDRTGAQADYTNYYQYGGNISAGKGHKFWTGGVLASQTLKFHIADDYTYNTGNMTVGGTLTENSSIRYKDNIEDLKYSLDKVLQMRGVSYTKKDSGVKEIGLIAEELNEIVPELVNKNEEGLPDSVSYGRVVSYLIEAIKEQQKQIEELKALIK